MNDPQKMVYRSTENHESVYVRYSESGNLYEEKYLSKEYSYSSMDGVVYGLASDLLSFTSEHTFYTYYDGEYIRSLLISPDGLSDDKYHMLKDAGFALEEGTLQETIQSVKKKDGRIIVTSFESPEAIEASEMGGLVSYNAEYVLDAKTHELISVKDVIEYDDGTVYNVGVDFIYDAEIPEGMKAFHSWNTNSKLRIFVRLRLFPIPEPRVKRVRVFRSPRVCRLPWNLILSLNLILARILRLRKYLSCILMRLVRSFLTSLKMMILILPFM